MLTAAAKLAKHNIDVLSSSGAPGGHALPIIFLEPSCWSMFVEDYRELKIENAETIAPPLLTGVGSKMRTSWPRQMLVQSGRARPWMGLRMPQFGEANVGQLVSLTVEFTEPRQELAGLDALVEGDRRVGDVGDVGLKLRFQSGLRLHLDALCGIGR